MKGKQEYDIGGGGEASIRDIRHGGRVPIRRIRVCLDKVNLLQCEVEDGNNAATKVQLLVTHAVRSLAVGEPICLLLPMSAIQSAC